MCTTGLGWPRWAFCHVTVIDLAVLTVHVASRPRFHVCAIIILSLQSIGSPGGDICCVVHMHMHLQTHTSMYAHVDAHTCTHTHTHTHTYTLTRTHTRTHTHTHTHVHTHTHIHTRHNHLEISNWPVFTLCTTHRHSWPE